MDRRVFLGAAASATLVATLPRRAVAAGGAVPRSIDDALRWIDALERAGSARATGAWPLSAVFDHLAQSVEMSLEGYPRSRGALYHGTVGAAAFAVFRWRGRMSHALDEPIPGAPPLATTGDWRPGAVRLRVALRRFAAHAGPLAPHFAYGPLDKGEYTLAHLWHIGNHRDEVVPS